MPEREEESLLEEMRETIRADRERAAARAARPPEPAPPPRSQQDEKGRLRRLLGR